MIIAKINDYEISREEYQAELTMVMQKFKLEEPNSDCKNKAIENLIDGYLLLNRAKSEEIDVNTDEVEAGVVDFMMKFETESEYRDMLEHNQVTEKDIRSKIKDKIIVSKYISEICDEKPEISEEKLYEIYRENIDHFVTQEMIRASHILLKGHDEETKTEAIELRKKINSVEDFKKFANDVSHCPSGCQCGDLGFFPRGKMIKEFEDVAFSLGVDEISQPIRTPFGYHIIMITDHKESKQADFESIKGSLYKRICRIESELALIKHIKELRDQADINIFEEKL